MKKLFLDANKRMGKYKDNECYWLGLTNKWCLLCYSILQ